MLPQLMPNIVAIHHKLIRNVIARHGCYEVKTVGDSFMIACREAYAAVQVACEIQQVLFRHDWGTYEVDYVYREFEMRCQEENSDYKAPTAMLPHSEYRALWNGLRVRVGIHTGLPDIRYDEVTKGFDYYGDTSNIAARTEAIGNGGQVLLTEWTWWSLSHTERASLRCTELGPQRLRGLEHPVDVYQLDGLPGRRYAELRTEIDVELPSADDRSEGPLNASSTILLSITESAHSAAAAVAAVLTNCFSAFSAAERVKGVQPLLQRWNIPIPQMTRGMTEEDHCRDLINRLAVRMSMLAQLRPRFNDMGGLGNPFSSRTSAAQQHGCWAVRSQVGDTADEDRMAVSIGSNMHKRPLLQFGDSVDSVEITLPLDLAAKTER
ncbi:unnamed protein product [Phytomonas sp. Hart1]|nr:unnamed protein product [Phytomonas sp. Hart1]|eukprot:CCW69686.1 unnamed protein product [Phytomonas sp. isolate Hart1]